MKKNNFLNRSLAVINDLTKDERQYLFNHVKRLKNAINDEDEVIVDSYRINNPNKGIYLVFLEDSTRTKESFRNAAEFHRSKISIFDVSHSSFNKKESYADTFSMLTGYDNQIFVVRSKEEGVCKWLEEAGKTYALRNQIKPPAFINAGDGKHEHPTQELLDEVTLLEDNNWDKTNLHLTLVGDLLNGRTVHSKAQGLSIFDNVKVDLIAPKELAMPDTYIKIMRENGFTIRIFKSIEEYLSQDDIANRWYFTRPQLERMGDEILKRADKLRNFITFKKEYIEKLPIDTKLYHPLPRHKEFPTIPTSIDDTPLNGWEKQSQNGYYLRIILLAAIAGKIGDDFSGVAYEEPIYNNDFIEELPMKQKKKEIKEGILPLKEGIAIDHICKGEEPNLIWNYLHTIHKVMKFDGHGYRGVAKSTTDHKFKGIASLPDIHELTESQLKILAAIIPNCTVNFISNRQVIRKLFLKMPPRIYGFDNLSCKNEDCITHPSHNENISAHFIRKGGNKFSCIYCEKMHSFKDIWIGE